MSKTAETRAVIEAMVDGLNDHRIDDIGEFFAEASAGWATPAAARRPA
jgi:cytochrome c553